MPQQPRPQRIRVQLALRFGLSLERRETGTTIDLSARGLAIASPTLYSPGSKLDMEIELPDGRRARLTAIVVWSAMEARVANEGRMGLRLDHADEEYFRYLSVAGKSPPPPPPPRVAAVPVASTLVEPAVREHRPRSERFFVPMQVRYGSPSPMTLRGLTKNFSATGFAMTCSSTLTPGDKLGFSLSLPNDTEAAGTGFVVWSRLKASSGGPRELVAGIRIDQVQPSYEEYLMVAAQRQVSREKGATPTASRPVERTLPPAARKPVTTSRPGTRRRQLAWQIGLLIAIVGSTLWLLRPTQPVEVVLRKMLAVRGVHSLTNSATSVTLNVSEPWHPSEADIAQLRSLLDEAGMHEVTIVDEHEHAVLTTDVGKLTADLK